MTTERAPAGLRYAPHAVILSVGYVVFAYAAVPDVLRARLGISFASFGLLMSAALGAFVVAQWPASRLPARYATADVLLAGTAVHALLGVALDLTGSFAALLALRFAWGLAGGLLLSVGATQVARLETGARATLQQGVYGGTLTLGGAVGFLLAPRFAAGPSLFGVHAFGAVLAVPAVALLWHHRGDGRTAPPPAAESTSSVGVALAPLVLLASLCYVAVIASYVTLSTFVTDYFRTLDVTGPLNALVLATATAGRVAGGGLAVRGTADARVVLGATLAAAAGLVALTATAGAALVVLPVVVMLAVSLPFGAVFNLAAAATDDEAAALATVVAAGNVAALALPAVTGALRDLTGSYRPGFLVLAGLNGLAAVAAVAIATRTTQ